MGGGRTFPGFGFLFVLDYGTDGAGSRTGGMDRSTAKQTSQPLAVMVEDPQRTQGRLILDRRLSGVTGIVKPSGSQIPPPTPSHNLQPWLLLPQP